MKIAILYSGLPNISLDIFNNHKKYLIDEYDCDIYCSSWYTTGIEKTIDIINPLEYHIEKINDVQNVFKEFLIYAKNKRPEVRPINVFSMYYKLSKSFDLIKNKTYDIAIRHRLDTKYDRKIELSISNLIKIPRDNDHGGINDRWAYGPPSLMEKYCSVFKYIPIYTQINQIRFHPETLLLHHLKQNNVPFTRTKDRILLRGDE